MSKDKEEPAFPISFDYFEKLSFRDMCALISLYKFAKHDRWNGIEHIEAFKVADNMCKQRMIEASKK